MFTHGRVLAILLASALSILIVGGATAAPPNRFIALPVLGIQTLFLNAEFVPEDRPDEVLAFVETGSLETECLVSLNESNVAGDVKTIWCAPRQIERDGRLMNGLFVHVFFFGEVPEHATLDVNAYQERMVANPAAIPCPEC